MPLPCEPWLDGLSLCDVDEVDPALIDRAILVATELLYWASGSQYRGLCTDTIRPCPPGAGAQWLAYPNALAVAARPLPGPGWAGGFGCGCTGDMIGCGCTGHPAIALPHTPVVEVTEILVDGDPLPADATVIVDDKWLVRSDNQPWPCCQDMSRLDTEPGTWSITYTFGTAPPAAGVLAAEVFACELVKGWTDDKTCRLPKRLTNITREGITATFLDSFQFLRDGGMGIYEVDAFIAQANPNGLRRQARIVDPYRRAARPRRVRP